MAVCWYDLWNQQIQYFLISLCCYIKLLEACLCLYVCKLCSLLTKTHVSENVSLRAVLWWLMAVGYWYLKTYKHKNVSMRVWLRCVWWFILLISYKTVKSACVKAIFGKSLCQGQRHSFHSHNIGSPVKASLHINSQNSSVILYLSVQLYIIWLAQITICQLISVLVFVYYRQLYRLSVESIICRCHATLFPWWSGVYCMSYLFSYSLNL